nr:hypothetical protein [Tanacetum cinerariifolium]
MVTLGRFLPHARGLGFKPRRWGFPSGAKKEWGLSPKAKVRVLHAAQLDVTLNQLAIHSKSELLSEQVLLFVEREMTRELRMTRLLTDLCHEVTDAVKDKANIIEGVKELGVAASGSDSTAFLRILRDDNLDKVKDIMNLIKETQKHTIEKLSHNLLLEIDDPISVALAYR